MIWRVENYMNIFNIYKKGLLKKLIKFNIIGDNEKIVKIIFVFVFIFFNMF